MVKALILGPVVTNTLAATRMGNNMVLALIIGLMVPSILVDGKMGNSMVKVNSVQDMKIMMVSGRMVNC